MIDMCNIMLKRSHQKLQLCNLKLFNWTSYEEVMNLQNYQIHNLRISKASIRNLKKFSHFDATPIISHKIYYMGGNGDSSQVQIMWILDEYMC
jgi:hypothetical protein